MLNFRLLEHRRAGRDQSKVVLSQAAAAATFTFLLRLDVDKGLNINICIFLLLYIFSSTSTCQENAILDGCSTVDDVGPDLQNVILPQNSKYCHKICFPSIHLF